MAYFQLKKEVCQSTTFGEKILYKMAYDRRPLLKIFSDKWMVREYVEKTVGSNYLPKTFFYSSEVMHELPSFLPIEFVMKASHCSGGSVLVWKGADKENKLPKTLSRRHSLSRYRINPLSIVERNFLSLANSWLKIDYSWHSSMIFPEWAYEGIPKGILFEELLLDDGNIPSDFKFFVFNGFVQFIRVDSPNSLGKKNMNHFDREWRELNFEFRGAGKKEFYDKSAKQIRKPNNLEKAILIAEELAKPVDFLRVDLYLVGEEIYFGELTSYPSAGRGSFYPEGLNRDIGNMLTLDTY